MPNWVRNILRVQETERTKDFEKEVEEFFDSISSSVIDEDGKIQSTDIDFQKIVPRPKDLDITSGTSTTNGKAVYLSREKGDHSEIDLIMKYPWVKGKEEIQTREDLIEYLLKNNIANIEEGKKALENFVKYGCETWYDWSYKYWGTKWNACHSYLDDNVLSFDTAWSTPSPIFFALSLKFPNLKFQIEFADEDQGSNCGILYVENGEMSEDLPECYTREAYEFAFNVQGAWIEALAEVDDDRAIELVKNNDDYYMALVNHAYEHMELYSDMALPFLSLALKKAKDEEKYEYAKKIQEMIDEKSGE